MPTYRGNRGNILQHWVLVELLSGLRQQRLDGLCFVDAYSMSPMATRSPKAATDQTSPEFDRVRARLPGERSPYEQAWLALNESLHSEYPSSAAFVRHCWETPLHLLLCEADRPTADEISGWLSGLDAHTTSFELHRDDWRERFRRAMPSTFDGYLFSFDPNMFDRHYVRVPKPENMYPDDISIVGTAIRDLPRVPIVIQLSTYSVNGDNSQRDVRESIVPKFGDYGFEMACYVRADNAMMSIIFCRDTSVASNLEAQFQAWLVRHRHESGAA
ncbi:MAG: hypothetical protein ACREC3_07880 [Methyloceanibacter sp.]